MIVAIFVTSASIFVSQQGQQKQSVDEQSEISYPAQNTAARESSGSSLAAYNESEAMRFVDFSGAAYCAGTLGHGVEKWDCAVCKKYPDVTATVVSDKGLFATDCNGFVAFDPNHGRNGTIVVSISGTDPASIQNWIDDLNFFAISPNDYMAAGCPQGCKVDRGFYYTYKAVQKKIREAVAGLKMKHPAAKTVVTGHSLGGAVAVHAVVDLALAGYPADMVFTYGQPRVGNDVFAKWYVSKFTQGKPHFRITHSHDPVPHLPTSGSGPIGGFTHVPVEVYYPRDSRGEHTVCDGSGEDLKCSDSNIVDLTLTDHLFYLGFHFISNYIGCKL
eukprot:jgi/Bigna1/38881/e_gw1.28.64.1